MDIHRGSDICCVLVADEEGATKFYLVHVCRLTRSFWEILYVTSHSATFVKKQISEFIFTKNKEIEFKLDPTDLKHVHSISLT